MLIMDQKVISLRDDEQFITLNIMLKISGIIETGGMAKSFLVENVVYVNNERENRRGRKLYRGDVVRVLNRSFLIK